MGTTRLFSTTTVEEQWRSLVGPWLKEQAGAAWRDPRPTVVLTPSRAEGFYLRSRMLEEGVTFLGLRFWTPSDARKFLLGEMASAVGVVPTTQPELRLVARACVEKLMRRNKPGTTAEATLTSVAQEPGPFLRAYDLLLGAGWNPAQKGAAYGQALAEAMETELESLGIATQAGLHRRLLQETTTKEKPLIANLLVTGFNATHWPLWDLLKAVVFSAERTAIALMKPRDFGEEIDQLWHGSWEQVLGTTTEIPEGPMDDIPESTFAGLVESYKGGFASEGTGEVDLSLLATPDLSSQVRVVTLKALEYLKNDSCTRLGIVFPESNGLALGVAEELRRLGVPLDNSIGSVAPGIFERRCWQSWIALQEEPSVAQLVVWLRSCEVQGLSSGIGELSAREIADVLENALGESLVDDLHFLARHLEENSTARLAGPVANFLRQRVELPEEALFADFLAMTREVVTLSGWKDYLARLRIDPPLWLRKNRAMLSRRTFLEWLKETTDSREWTAGADGNHFYGKVHLLIYAQMTGQTWSHLILTGLNEGVWPRLFEAGAFGSRHELATLNAQARTLNVRGTTQGSQGEGHEAVRADHGHCLLPLERQNLALRDLCVALEGTSEAVCLAAMTTETGRSLLPSDFFNHAYQFKTGRLLDETVFRNLAMATSKWCKRHENLFQSTEKPNIAETIAATQIAYEARRDATRSFGPYEFAYSEPPPEPIQLSCKTWEDAWNHPATVWLEKVVGVSSWPEGTLSWPRSIGTWVHRWLTMALRDCAERNSTENFLSLLRAVADHEPIRARERARAVGIELYPWWDQVCGQARAIVLGLGETLAPYLAGKQVLSEFKLPKNLTIALPGTEQADFILTGRIDLLLVESNLTAFDSEKSRFSNSPCWVIDFKTGSAQSLTAKKIGKGMGLQAVLYALAVRTMGAGPTSISLHTADAPLKQQVELDDVIEMRSLFHSLDKLHRGGVFGMRADAENDYGYSPAYPMATRLPPGNILEAKWALVHGTDTATEEEA